MIDPRLLDQVAKDPFLAYMHSHALAFDRYLDLTNALTINIKGIRYDPLAATCEPVAVDEDIGYSHRWTKKYDHRTLWKLYNLMWHYRLNPDQMPKYTMMITLTGSHASPRTLSRGGLSHMKYLVKFHEAHRLEKHMIKAYLGTTDYLSILEGHPESGYVHAHDLYLLDTLPSDKTLEIIENHWNNTQGMGSKEHGFKPEIKAPQDFKNLQSLIAYPMAYVGKTSIGALQEWTKYDLVFNTSLWLSPKHPLKGGIGKRIRAFQPSRSLSTLMNQEPIERGYVHLETTMRNKTNSQDPVILYQSPNYEDNLVAWERLGGEV